MIRWLKDWAANFMKFKTRLKIINGFIEVLKETGKKQYHYKHYQNPNKIKLLIARIKIAKACSKRRISAQEWAGFRNLI